MHFLVSNTIQIPFKNEKKSYSMPDDTVRSSVVIQGIRGQDRQKSAKLSNSASTSFIILVVATKQTRLMVTIHVEEALQRIFEPWRV